MIAFHGKQEMKEFYLARVRAHRAADELIHGVYWEQGKGCMVGCTLHSANHAAYETALGIPRLLAWLAEGLFESLPSPADLAWPEAFLESIPVGGDLTLVWPQFARALLSNPTYGVLQYVQRSHYDKQAKAMQNIITYYQQWIDTGVKPAPAPAATAATVVAAAATAAPATAADAAAYVAAAATATAATAPATAAAYAAEAAEADRRNAARLWQAETLLTLLRAAPVPIPA